jgi:DNA/RNA endonuclease YhcR with UshA esterase domain
MIEKPKLLMIVILITFTGILGIYGYAVSIEAKTIPIADLGSQHIGSMVEVEGYIKDIDTWEGGDLEIVLVDYTSGKTIDVNVDSEATENMESQDKMTPGAKVRVNGLVEDYKGELLLSVRSSEGIKILQAAPGDIQSLKIILDRPEVFEGILVSVKGQVWEIEEIGSINAYTFTLQNISDGRYYSVNCIMFNTSRLMDRDDKAIQYGDEVILTGTFDYYEYNGIWQIRSDEGKASLEKID